MSSSLTATTEVEQEIPLKELKPFDVDKQFEETVQLVNGRHENTYVEIVKRDIEIQSHEQSPTNHDVGVQSHKLSPTNHTITEQIEDPTLLKIITTTSEVEQEINDSQTELNHHELPTNLSITEQIDDPVLSKVAATMSEAEQKTNKSDTELNHHKVASNGAVPEDNDESKILIFSSNRDLTVPAKPPESTWDIIETFFKYDYL